ncbi:hypothetical protein [Methanothermobacter sp. K4]|uniref:hypothetical protein n=1 Tax=Methanothermobacter sp. K4 TaxID=2913262 RepID=UPI001EDC78CF|nr:hypothetical protein [Methanothermobacter sp. K4]MCG2827893.1 hypothetical protein [Methanothermobacter sp. K4]
MDYRNIVIGAMILIIALMVGFNVALYMGAQEQNVTQLDWADNATTDMSFANESPAPVSTDNTKTTTKRTRTNITPGEGNTTEPEEPEPPAQNQTT